MCGDGVCGEECARRFGDLTSYEEKGEKKTIYVCWACDDEGPLFVYADGITDAYGREV